MAAVSDSETVTNFFLNLHSSALPTLLAPSTNVHLMPHVDIDGTPNSVYRGDPSIIHATIAFPNWDCGVRDMNWEVALLRVQSSMDFSVIPSHQRRLDFLIDGHF